MLISFAKFYYLHFPRFSSFFLSERNQAMQENSLILINQFITARLYVTIVTLLFRFNLFQMMKNKMQNNEGIRKRKLLLTTGISLTTVGLVLLVVHPFMIESISNMMFSLQSSGFVYNVWKKNPMPLKLEFYLFNWTNPEDFYKTSVKPKFEELGPFVFLETREKVNIEWNDHNNTVTYGLQRFWYFDRESSVHDLSMKVVSINPIVAVRFFDWFSHLYILVIVYLHFKFLILRSFLIPFTSIFT